MTTELRKTLANHLRTVRELAGISPEQASQSLEGRVSASYIRRLEKGDNGPTVEAVAQLCSAYGTNLARFFATLPAIEAEPKKPARKTA